MKKILFSLFLFSLFSFPFVAQAKVEQPGKPVYTTVEQVQQMIDDSLVSIQEAIDGLIADISALVDRVTGAENDINSLETQTAQNSADIDNAETRLDGYDTDITKLNNIVMDMSDDTTEACVGCESRLGVLEGLFSEISTNITNIFTSLGILENDVEKNTADISELQNQTPPAQKQLKVYDANNQDLGLLINPSISGSSGYEVFHEELGRVIRFDASAKIQHLSTAVYPTTDCSGQGYIQRGGTEDFGWFDYVFHIGGNRYGYFDPFMPATTITYASALQFDGSCTLTGARTALMFPVVETTYPYDQQVTIPFDVRYESALPSLQIEFQKNAPVPLTIVPVHIPSGYSTMTFRVSTTGSIADYAILVSYDGGSTFTEQKRVSCGGSTCPDTTVPILSDYYEFSNGTSSGNITAIATLN